MRSGEQLQNDIEAFRRQQKDLAARQAIYNQQQLDFMTQKNTLAAQQFDFADRLASYNAQVKQFNDGLARFNEEQNAFRTEKQKFEEEKQTLEAQRSKLDEDKEAFEKQKTEFEKAQLETEKKKLETAAEYQEKNADIDKQLAALKERELDLESRENALNAARREFNSRRYAAEYANGSAEPPYPGYGVPYPAPSGFLENEYRRPAQPRTAPAPETAPAAAKQEGIDLDDLRRRAQTDGIRLKTAGSMDAGKNKAEAPASAPTFFNKGLTLFKSALITFCIILAESLVIFFVKDRLNVSGLYPAVGCGVGLAGFLLCTVLYACGYRPQARRGKHPGYLLNASIIFVIGVIVVSMVAVYLKADLKQPRELLAYVILPVIYLVNIILFAVFYYLFSLNAKNSAKN